MQENMGLFALDIIVICTCFMVNIIKAVKEVKITFYALNCIASL